MWFSWRDAVCRLGGLNYCSVFAVRLTFLLRHRCLLFVSCHCRKSCCQNFLFQNWLKVNRFCALPMCLFVHFLFTLLSLEGFRVPELLFFVSGFQCGTVCFSCWGVSKSGVTCFFRPCPDSHHSTGNTLCLSLWPMCRFVWYIPTIFNHTGFLQQHFSNRLNTLLTINKPTGSYSWMHRLTDWYSFLHSCLTFLQIMLLFEGLKNIDSVKNRKHVIY